MMLISITIENKIIIIFILIIFKGTSKNYFFWCRCLTQMYVIFLYKPDYTLSFLHPLDKKIYSQKFLSETKKATDLSGLF